MKIAIDAGHGSNTAGKRTPDGYREHWANVKVASYFADAMSRCGVLFIKTGWDDDNSKDDPDTSLSARQREIKESKCDYSISFHFNACGDGKSYNSGEGIETLISDKAPADSLKMANCIQAQLIKGTKQKNRGVKTQALAMCNCSVMGTKASVLVECAFMTNSREAELMMSDAFCLECAEEAAKGFCDYVGIEYISRGAEKPVPVPSYVPSTTPKRVGKVTASTLNVRQGPGTGYPLYDAWSTLSKGNLVDVCDEKDGWLYIRIVKGFGDNNCQTMHFAWVSAKYIQ